MLSAGEAAAREGAAGDGTVGEAAALAQDFKEFQAKRAKDIEKVAKTNKSSATVLTNIKRAMTLYESTNERGVMLEKVYRALLSIQPTSVEAERGTKIKEN